MQHTYSLRRLAAAVSTLFSSAALAAGPVESITVIGQSTPADAIARSHSVISDAELDRRSSATLGATLDGLPGISSTGFGPNASRPIVRGQDADHIRILQNSLPVGDVSAISFDHAIPVGVGVLDSIEILRGPAALLYGGNAVGGAINLVDRRIPRRMPERASGEVELSYGSAASERNLAAALDGGTGRLAWHLDAATRRAGDLRVPRFTDDGDEPVTGTRVRNSAAQSENGAAGLAWVNANGYWGASIEGFDTTYGVPKETDITIDLRQRRLALGGEQRFDDGIWQRVRARAAFSDYRHTELEGDEIGSVYDTQNQTLRLEMKHRALGGFEGITGLQWESARFASGGEEAYMPNVRTRQFGAFLMEETRVGNVVLRGGLRVDQVRHSPNATYVLEELGEDINGDGLIDHEAGEHPGEVHVETDRVVRKFTPRSVSAEAVWTLDAANHLGVSLSRVERAPSHFELYAQGVHHASGLFESGDLTLQKERGNHIDLTWNHVHGAHALRVSAFASRYRNYITLLDQNQAYLHIHDHAHEHEAETPGMGHDEEPEAYEAAPVYRFTGVPARFHGIELSHSVEYDVGAWRFTPEVGFDWIRARNTQTDSPMPRIAPRRLSLALGMQGQGWSLRPELQWVGRSTPSADDTAVAGYALFGVHARYALPKFAKGAELFLDAQNLGDKLAFRATTVAEVRQFTPLAGRSVSLGLKAKF